MSPDEGAELVPEPPRSKLPLLTRDAIKPENPNIDTFLSDHSVEEIYQKTDLASEELYDYHGETHNDDLKRRGALVLDYIRANVPEEVANEFLKDFDEELFHTIVDWHDRYIKATPSIDNNLFGMIVLNQAVGVSEEESIRLFKEQAGDRFSKEQIETLVVGIRATIPTFIHGSVHQDELRPGIPFEAVLVALCDLGSSIEGEEQFVQESNALLRERALGVKMLLERGLLSEDEKDLIGETIMSWTEGQAAFLQGRIERLPTDMLAVSNDTIRKVLETWFVSSHENSRKYLTVIKERRKSLYDRSQPREDHPIGWFEDLIDNCGYEPPYLPQAA